MPEYDWILKKFSSNITNAEVPRCPWLCTQPFKQVAADSRVKRRSVGVDSHLSADHKRSCLGSVCKHKTNTSSFKCGWWGQRGVSLKKQGNIGTGSKFFLALLLVLVLQIRIWFFFLKKNWIQSLESMILKSPTPDSGKPLTVEQAALNFPVLKHSEIFCWLCDSFWSFSEP